jgi:hypothetical protein
MTSRVPTIKNWYAVSWPCLQRVAVGSEGTGQFSIRLGEDGKKELHLDPFWSRYAKSQDVAEFQAVTAEAKRLLSE